MTIMIAYSKAKVLYKRCLDHVNEVLTQDVRELKMLISRFLEHGKWLNCSVRNFLYFMFSHIF